MLGKNKKLQTRFAYTRQIAWIARFSYFMSLYMIMNKKATSFYQINIFF